MERPIKERKPRNPLRGSGQPDRNIVGETKPRGTAGGPCKTCTHPERQRIEQMILDGTPWKRIEDEVTFGEPTDDAIKRHAQRCIPDIMRQRMATIQIPDGITVDLVMEHIQDALRMSKESADLVFDEDEHGVIREAAQGRSAAIRTRVECARAAGEVIGMFDTKKIDLILRMPETQEMISKIVEAVCPGCALKVRELLTGNEQ